ncbi:hypothetical protein [Haloarcula laminariae]|uniref:hypothetical protein n=1 Tax=Haloarcula laminariae TaxID=2961577 RepID=UPI0024068997|nr:hypothetical protein [Halomicroarcula sp. FL173]
MVDGSVTSATADRDSFILDIEDHSLVADRLLAASWSDSDYLGDLGVHTVTESASSVSIVPTDGSGETNADGVYAAGPLTETHHQALLNAVTAPASHSK